MASAHRVADEVEHQEARARDELGRKLRGIDRGDEGRKRRGYRHVVSPVGAALRAEP
jgi:hypothetical protein